MKKIIIFVLLVLPISVFSQNVYMEINDHYKKVDEKEYGTYQYVSSSYSSFRPLIIFVTDKEVLNKIYPKMNLLRGTKQEYTDVHILGIKGFDKNNISETDTKIIDVFLQSITKYREDNDLPIFSFKEEIKFIEKEEEFNKHLSWRNSQKQK